jgi:hypothetical protein
MFRYRRICAVAAVVIVAAMAPAGAAHAQAPSPYQGAAPCVLGGTPDGGYGAIIVEEATLPASQTFGAGCWFQVPAGHGSTLDYEASTASHWRVFTTGSTYPPDAHTVTTIASSDDASPPIGHLSVSLGLDDYIVIEIGGGVVCAPAADLCAMSGTVAAHV